MFTAVFKQHFPQAFMDLTCLKAPIDVQADLSGSVPIPISVSRPHIVSFQWFQVVVPCGHCVSAD